MNRRLEIPDEQWAKRGTIDADVHAAVLIELCGGLENILSVNGSGSRLSFGLHNPRLVDLAALRQMGVLSVLMQVDGVQLILGCEAERLLYEAIAILNEAKWEH